MASGGFYLMHRGWQDHPVFRAEEFSRRDAFVWMIEEAAFAERRVGTGAGIITLARGQFTHSIRFMATAWGWESTKVARFIKALSVEKMIVTETATGGATGQTVITICNYNKYQAFKEDAATARATATPQQRHSNATNNKEGNKGTKVIEDGVITPSSAKRATRLPDGWRPATLKRDTVAGEIAEARGQDWMRRTFETFENHWRSATGKGAVKLDWQGTWANWVINQDQRDGSGRNAGYRNGNGSARKSGDGFANALGRAAEFFGPDDDG